jgi:hypothetical protein
MRIGYIVKVLTLVAFVASPQISHGQDAKALLSKGNKLFTAGEYQAAFDVFKEAYDKKPEAVFLRSMSFSLLKLYKHEKARELLEKYLKDFPKAKDTQKLKDLHAKLEVVIQTKVKIESTPPGAEVYIDALAAGRVGKTPAELTIEPGKHLVILKMKDFYLTTQSMQIGPKETKSLSIVLEVPLKVNSDPPGASVHFGSADSKTQGTTPLETGIKPGKQAVFVKLAGYKTYKSEMDVVAKQPVDVNAVMELGINVASRPPGAKVTINGQEVPGMTPLETGVPRGTHTVVVKHDVCDPYTEKVEVLPGKDTNVSATLSGCGLLMMRTDLSGAAVKVGERALGATPLEEAAVPKGSHTLTVSHPDRRPWSKALDFSDSEMVSAKVKLGRKSWPVWVAGGLAVAGLIAGSVGAGLAAKNTNDYEEIPAGNPNAGDCVPSGEPDAAPEACNYGMHHMSTIGFSVAGASAVTGFLYYWFMVRHDAKVTRQPMGTGATTAAKPQPKL